MNSQAEMMFTLWDVEHGLAIWIRTPKGHNHWIDAGRNTGQDFSPAWHVANAYGETKLDYMIISHADGDHINDLPDVIEYLGDPRVLRHNKSVPDRDKFGGETCAYQREYKRLECKLNSPLDWNVNPRNPQFNGGVNVEVESLSFREAGNINNSSLVAVYAYAGWTIVMPGDIEREGWELLWSKYDAKFIPLLDSARIRILVAPHHGRETGYSSHMMQVIQPHLVLISDEFGQEPTDPRFQREPLGLRIDGEEVKYFSTKTSGSTPSRIQVCIQPDGKGNIRQQNRKE